MATPFHYVYVLKSMKDGLFYVGSTSDLPSRISRHQKGQVESTKARLPVALIFFEAYRNKFDVLRREDYLKSSKGKQTLRNMLKEYLMTNKQGEVA